MADRIGRQALTQVRADRRAFELETFGSSRVRVPVASKASVTSGPAPAIAPTRREMVAPNVVATPVTRVTTTRTVRPVSTVKGPTAPPPTVPSGPAVLPPPTPTSTPAPASPSSMEQPMIQANPFPTINTRGTAGVRRDFDLGGAIEGAAGALGGGGGIRDAIVGGLAGGFRDSGGGSEPPSGQPTVPGNFAPTGAGPCPDGTFKNPFGNNCIDLIPGGATQGGGMVVSGGDPVLGRYGVAMVPQAMERIRRRCPRGMVLGMDNLCYNKRDLRKDERKWNPGRKPLLTGGDLNAISTALSAAKKLDRQKKRLKQAARAFDRVS